MKKAGRTYTLEFGGAMTLYVLAVVLSIFLLRFTTGSPWAYPVAVLPVVPLGLAMMAFLRFLNRMDELQRRIQLTAVAFSLAAVIMVTVTYGFLENAGLPRLSWIWIGPMAIGLWGLSLAVATRRYR